MARDSEESVERLRGWLAAGSKADAKDAPKALIDSLALLNQRMDELDPDLANSDWVKRLMVAGLGEVACELSNQWPGDESLQEKILDTLTLLCKIAEDSAIETLVAVGCAGSSSSAPLDISFVTVLTRALETHRTDALVQSSALCLLGAAGQVKAAADFLLRHKVAASISTALRINCERAEEISAGRKAGSCSSANNQSGDDTDEVLRDCSRVAKYCLMAVWNFCTALPPTKSNSKSGKNVLPVAASAFVDAGLIEGILDSMRAMPDSEDVAHWGCGALFIVLKHEPRARRTAEVLGAAKVADRASTTFRGAEWLHYAQKMLQQLKQQGWSSWKDADPTLLSRADRNCQTSMLEMPSPSKRRRTQRSTAGSDGRLRVSRAELTEKYVTRSRFKEVWQILKDVGWHGPHKNPNKLGTTPHLYCSSNAAHPQSGNRTCSQNGENDSRAAPVGDKIEEGVNAFSDLNLIAWLVDGSSIDEGLRSVQIQLCNTIVDRMEDNDKEEEAEVSSQPKKAARLDEGRKRGKKEGELPLGSSNTGKDHSTRVTSSANSRASGKDVSRAQRLVKSTGKKSNGNRRQSYESDDILWAKLGNDPWWPAREIINPSEDRLQDFNNHDKSGNSVCVRFLPSSTNQWGWVKSRQVLRPYRHHKQDVLAKFSDKEKKKKGLKEAIAEAEKLSGGLSTSSGEDDGENSETGDEEEEDLSFASSGNDLDKGAQAAAGNALLLKNTGRSEAYSVKRNRTFTEASVSSDKYFHSHPKGKPALAASSSAISVAGKRAESVESRSKQSCNVRRGNRKLANLGVKSEPSNHSAVQGADDNRAEEVSVPELTWPTTVELAQGGDFGPSSQLVGRAQQQTPREHTQAVQLLVSKLRDRRFKDWGGLVKQGAFNLLLYGFGSKLDLLEKFRKDELQANIVLEARGFEEATRVGTILNLLADDLLHCKEEVWSEEPSTYARNLVAWLGPRRPRPPPKLTWNDLRYRGGWTWKACKGLHSYLYLRPGVTHTDTSEHGVHFFHEECEAVDFARKHGVDFNTRMGHIKEPPLGCSGSGERSLLSSVASQSNVTLAKCAQGADEAAAVSAPSLIDMALYCASKTQRDYRQDPLDFVDDPSFVDGTSGVDGISSDTGSGRRRVLGGGGGHEVIVIMVHSLDGNPFMRHRSTQAALSILAASPRISLVASVDHVNAALLWDVDIATKFNWLWCETTTYAEYEHEAKYVLQHTVKAASQGNAGRRTASGHGSREVARTGPKGDPGAENTMNEEGIASILESFNKRQIQVLKLLCKGGRPGGTSSSSLSSSPPDRVPRTQLLAACKHENYAQDDHQLTKLLQESLDHKLVEQWNSGRQGFMLRINPVFSPAIRARLS